MRQHMTLPDTCTKEHVWFGWTSMCGLVGHLNLVIPLNPTQGREMARVLMNSGLSLVRSACGEQDGELPHSCCTRWLHSLPWPTGHGAKLTCL